MPPTLAQLERFCDPQIQAMRRAWLVHQVTKAAQALATLDGIDPDDPGRETSDRIVTAIAAADTALRSAMRELCLADPAG